ncbi:MAG: hypothetical protein QOJ01_1148 [Solirubrobacterales bacterium]|jgi:hypothetical protein|nr:hypothetical protein [Solirubrobacterales bacterium]
MTIASAIALNIAAAAVLLTLLFVAMRLPHLVTGKPSEASLRRAARRAARHAAVRPGAQAHADGRRGEPVYSR